MMSAAPQPWPPKVKAYGVELQALCAEELERIRTWRNHPSIAELMLDQTYITAEMQQAWFAGLQGDPTRAYWLVVFKNQPIGVASLSKIDQIQGTAEPGMYIFPEQFRNNIVPFCVAFALNDFAFEALGLRCLLGKIFTSNEASVRFHLKCGYQPVAASEPSSDPQAQNLIFYHLTYENYLVARAPVAHFIRY